MMIPTSREVHDSAEPERRAIRAVVDELRRIQARIAELCSTLPDPDEQRAVLECVNRDLLSDAIETLAVVASLSKAQLRDEFERHQQRLAHPRRIG